MTRCPSNDSNDIWRPRENGIEILQNLMREKLRCKTCITHTSHVSTKTRVNSPTSKPQTVPQNTRRGTWHNIITPSLVCPPHSIPRAKSKSCMPPSPHIAHGPELSVRHFPANCLSSGTSNRTAYTMKPAVIARQADCSATGAAGGMPAPRLSSLPPDVSTSIVDSLPDSTLRQLPSSTPMFSSVHTQSHFRALIRKRYKLSRNPTSSPWGRLYHALRRERCHLCPAENVKPFAYVASVALATAGVPTLFPVCATCFDNVRQESKLHKGSFVAVVDGGRDSGVLYDDFATGTLRKVTYR